VWDAESGQVVSGPFEGHTSMVTSVAFSPDGKHIVSGSGDQTVQVWDAESGQVVSGPFEGHTDGVTSVAFSPDGKHILSGSGDQTIHMWGAYPSKVVPVAFESHTISLRSTASSDFCDNDWKLNNGWIYCKNHEFLFWVPPSYRTGLWRPRNTLVIGKYSTRLELSQFFCGMAWAQCWKYQTSST
jgi:WD40 repeat protein